MVTTIVTFISKLKKQLGGAISLLNTITGVDSANPTDCQKEYISEIIITWHEIMI